MKTPKNWILLVFLFNCTPKILQREKQQRRYYHPWICPFAMFLAQEILFYPFIGLKSGSEWFYAIVGFITTGIIAPLISLIAVVQIGHNFTDIGKRVNKKMITILAFIIIWLIGPLIGIPRTGATTFEIGLQPVFPGLSPIISAVIFFAVTGFLAISKQNC